MKSACIDNYTDSVEDIHIAEKPLPDPGPGQVRVRMLMSPVNPSDLNFVHGTYRSALERIIWNQGASEDNKLFYDAGHVTACPHPPYALGGEGIGVVDAAGAGLMARRLLGKRVAIAGGPPNGTWQEFTLAQAMKSVVLPDSIADEQGAMFFVNPLTAWVITRKVLAVPKGAWLLLTAAGSALGKSVVRLGRRYGFKTLCVVRSGYNSDVLRSLGADAIVETGTQDLISEVFRITGGRGAGHAMDCVGGRLSAQVVRCLGLNGRLLLYGTLANQPMELTIRDLMMPAAHISGFLLPTWLSQQSPLTLLQTMRSVKRLTAEGMFDTEIEAYFPLERVSEAVEAATRAGRSGKIMLRISGR
jgi:NADPH:quinone reductase-like Zn-dependent oxidoreductase